MQLIPLDPDNLEHVELTYDILLKRYESCCINITQSTMPSMEKHIATLKSDRFKYYYIIEYKKILIGVIYVINQNNELGFFLHARNSTTAYKQNKAELHAIVNSWPIDTNNTRKVFIYYYLKCAFDLLRNKHLNLTKITSKVNWDNDLSRSGTEFIGLKPKYIYYEYE